MSNVGRMYETGRGVPADIATAMQWYDAQPRPTTRAPCCLGQIYIQRRATKNEAFGRQCGRALPPTSAMLPPPPISACFTRSDREGC